MIMTKRSSYFIYIKFPFTGDIYTAEYIKFKKYASDNSIIDVYTIINNVIVFKECDYSSFETWKITFSAIPLQDYVLND